MKVVHPHNRTLPLGRMSCLALVLLLLANPLLAAVAASKDCTDQCCCCADPGQAPLTATISISIDTDMKAGCCGPAGSTPCHMTADRLPDASPVLIQTVQPSPAKAFHLLHNSEIASVYPSTTRISISPVGTLPKSHRIPLYLKTCRLIC